MRKTVYTIDGIGETKDEKQAYAASRAGYEVTAKVV